MKTFQWLISTVIATAVLSGCYTQFAMVDKTPPREEVSWVVDSTTGDSVKIINRTDTVYTHAWQTCIWERDLMGYPCLRCYDSFYPRDWFYYHYSPWWYYDYPYYYGGRRHYRHRRYEVITEPSKTEPDGPSGSSYRSPTRGIPDPKAEGVPRSSGNVHASGREQSAPAQSNEPVKGEIIIPAESEKKPVIIENRSRGVPAAGTPVPAPDRSETSASVESASSEAHSSTPPPSSDKAPSAGSAATPSRNSSQESYQRSSGGQKGPHLRKTRRW